MGARLSQSQPMARVNSGCLLLINPWSTTGFGPYTFDETILLHLMSKSAGLSILSTKLSDEVW